MDPFILRLALLAVVAGVAPGVPASSAQAGGLAFRGNSLGMPLSQFRSTNADSVCTDTTPKFFGSENPRAKPISGEVICIASPYPATVAGQPIARAQYHFFSGKLWEMRISIEPQYFGDVMASLVHTWQLDSAYRHDMIADSESFQSNIGDQWGGVTASWKIADAHEFISMREGPGNGPGKGGKFPLSLIVVQDTSGESPGCEMRAADDGACAPEPSR